MIYFVVFIAIGFIIGIIEALKKEEVLYFWLSIISFTLIGAVVATTLGCIVGPKLPQEEVIVRQELLPISTTETEKFLKIYTNTEETKYRYTVETDKGITTKNKELSRVIIREGNYSPMIIKHTYSFKKHWYSWFGFCDGGGNYIEILLPENSIVYSNE